MGNDDWKLQVSYKTPSGDLINVRASTADELSQCQWPHLQWRRLLQRPLRQARPAYTERGITSRESPQRQASLTQCGCVLCLRGQTSASQ